MAATLSEQVALVTGGVHGVGREVSEALIRAGARVAAGYSRDWSAAEAFFVEHGNHGVSVHQGELDLADDCERVVEEVIDRHGRLDILVNAAGVTSESASGLDAAQRARAAEVNLAGAYSMIRAVRPHMERSRHGRIIGISPVTDGLTGDTNGRRVATQATLTPQLAPEFDGSGISIMCIVPNIAIAQFGTAADAELDELARLVVRLAGPDGAEHHGGVYVLAGADAGTATTAETTKRSSQ